MIFFYTKQDLSDYSQLINIFRAKLKDKPLSHILKDPELLKASIKEYSRHNFQKTLLKLVEMKRKRDKERENSSALSENKEIISNSDPNKDNTNENSTVITVDSSSKLDNKDDIKIDESQNLITTDSNTKIDETCFNDSIKINEKQTLPAAETNSKTNEICDKEEIKIDEKQEGNSKIDGGEDKNASTKIEESKTVDTNEADNKTQKSTTTNNDFQYQPKRQSFCYVYNVVKLK